MNGTTFQLLVVWITACYVFSLTSTLGFEALGYQFASPLWFLILFSAVNSTLLLLWVVFWALPFRFDGPSQWADRAYYWVTAAGQGYRVQMWTAMAHGSTALVFASAGVWVWYSRTGHATSQLLDTDLPPGALDHRNDGWFQWAQVVQLVSLGLVVQFADVIGEVHLLLFQSDHSIGVVDRVPDTEEVSVRPLRSEDISAMGRVREQLRRGLVSGAWTDTDPRRRGGKRTTRVASNEDAVYAENQALLLALRHQDPLHDNWNAVPHG
jgi:hypothetical protein